METSNHIKIGWGEREEGGRRYVDANALEEPAAFIFRVKRETAGCFLYPPQYTVSLLI